MSYQVLYRAYRPSKFSEVVGQQYIIKTLQNAVKNNSIAHAYLFCGPRGTGKTSIAKIFAKAINCANAKGDACDECENCKEANRNTNPDIIELDAASNNGVEEIRDIVKNVNFAPINGKYKVFIIDEVHMLSTSAFNAFLKTLEEPPSHAIFILATTDPNKIIPTVLSRCQRYNFSKLRPFEIKGRMKEILEKEGVQYEDKALDIIANLADGGLRDALSILEQYLAYNRDVVCVKDVEKLFALSRNEEKIDLLLKSHAGKAGEAINSLRELYQKGVDLQRLALELLEMVKEALIYADQPSDQLLNQLTRIEAQQMNHSISSVALLEDITILESVLDRAKSSQSFLSSLELAFIKMSGIRNKVYTTKEETVVEKEVEESVQAVESPIEKAPVEEKEEETETKVESDEPIEEPVEEAVEVKTVSNSEHDLSDHLLNVLKTATKNDKINDGIIINRLELYKNHLEYRKFYMLLKDAKLFASNSDAIIINVQPSQVAAINELTMNRDLYRFINSEFRIDKMVYAADVSQIQDAVQRWRELTEEERMNTYLVQKYSMEKEMTLEEKLTDMFDNVEIED